MNRDHVLDCDGLMDWSGPFTEPTSDLSFGLFFFFFLISKEKSNFGPWIDPDCRTRNVKFRSISPVYKKNQP